METMTRSQWTCQGEKHSTAKFLEKTWSWSVKDADCLVELNTKWYSHGPNKWLFRKVSISLSIYYEILGSAMRYHPLWEKHLFLEMASISLCFFAFLLLIIFYEKFLNRCQHFYEDILFADAWRVRMGLISIIPMVTWALAWYLSQPVVTSVIPGYKTPEQVWQNAAATDLVGSF